MAGKKETKATASVTSNIRRRLRNSEVTASVGKLLRKSAKGVWLFMQSDALADGAVKKKYFVYDVRTFVLPARNRRTEYDSFRNATTDFHRREKELSKSKR
jgi:hypothetical protein